MLRLVKNRIKAFVTEINFQREPQDVEGSHLFQGIPFNYFDVKELSKYLTPVVKNFTFEFMNFNQYILS